MMAFRSTFPKLCGQVPKLVQAEVGRGEERVAHLHTKQSLAVARACWQIVMPQVGPLEQLMLRTEALLEEVAIHGGGERASIDTVLRGSRRVRERTSQGKRQYLALVVNIQGIEEFLGAQAVEREQHALWLH